jgi:hypothetical protein
MDGLDSFPDEDVAQSPNGDELARSGVQPETGTEYLWNATSGCLHASIETGVRFAESISHPKHPRLTDDRCVSTQPRSVGDIHQANPNVGYPSEAAAQLTVDNAR